MSKLLNFVFVLTLLSGTSYAQDSIRAMRYSGKNTVKTDHFVFLYLNQNENKATLSYLDTGPGGKKIPLAFSSNLKSIKIHTIHANTPNRSNPSMDSDAHKYTNDGGKSHVLKEMTLPAGYVIKPETVRGVSYGEGCDRMTFSGVDKTVALCSVDHVQDVTIEWEFMAYPTVKE